MNTKRKQLLQQQADEHKKLERAMVETAQALYKLKLINEELTEMED